MRDREWALSVLHCWFVATPERIRDWRDSLGMNQAEFGVHLGGFERETLDPPRVMPPRGYSSQAVGEWERGKARIPYWLHVLHHRAMAGKRRMEASREDLTPEQWALAQRAAFFAVMGVPDKFAAERLDVEVERLRAWRREKWWEDAYRAAEEREVGDMRAHALRVLRLALYREELGERVAKCTTAVWVLDRQAPEFRRQPTRRDEDLETGGAPYRIGGLPGGFARNPDPETTLGTDEDLNALFDEQHEDD